MAAFKVSMFEDFRQFNTLEAGSYSEAVKKFVYDRVYESSQYPGEGIVYAMCLFDHGATFAFDVTWNPIITKTLDITATARAL